MYVPFAGGYMTLLKGIQIAGSLPALSLKTFLKTGNALSAGHLKKILNLKAKTNSFKFEAIFIKVASNLMKIFYKESDLPVSLKPGDAPGFLVLNYQIYILGIQK